MIPCNPLNRYFRCALLAAMSLASWPHLSRAEEIKTGFVERVYRDETGTHRYMVFVPASYTPDKKWPVILYLHGSSARGMDNQLQLVGGLAPQIRARKDSFPFLAVFPQSEDVDGRLQDGWKADSADGKRALRILDAVEKQFSVDTSREILTGWSMGGTGAWNLAVAAPRRWSAVVVVAGAGDPAHAAALKNVPVWAFHGDKDLALPLELDRRMVTAVREVGGRAYLTVLPEVRHNVGHVVYSDDALYKWMWNPKAEPQQASFVRNAKRKPNLAEMGREFNPPFHPAVEVPQALFVRVDNESLEALAYALPDLLPDDALAGWVGNVSQSTRAAGLRFDVLLAGINYRGELERVKINTRKDGWMNIQIGLRNLIMQINSTHVDGFLMSATAGPMQIVIGQERPAWLSIDVRPYLEQHKVRFERGAVSFDIENDNWYVTSPSYVSARGLPLLRRRMSSSVSSNLVSGTYSRKNEIESQVTSSVPTMIQQLEERLEQQMDTPRTIGEWPMPAYQPRFKVWPAQLQVDDTGVSAIFGMTVASPSLEPLDKPIQRINHEPVAIEKFPKTRGVHVAQSGAALEGLSAAVCGTRTAIADVRDLTIPEFATLGDLDTMTAIIPDLKRFGDQLQIRTRVHAVGPMSLSRASSVKLATNSDQADKVPELQLKMHGLKIVVETKTLPHQDDWAPCAEFDLQLTQKITLNLEKPGFDSRIIHQNWDDQPSVTVTGRFSDDYHPVDRTLDDRQVAAIWTAGWKSVEEHDLFQQVAAPVVAFGTARFRAEHVRWTDPFLDVRFLLARTRITNKSDKPLEYELRGPFSEWGGPYKLAPGDFHEFKVPYDLTFRHYEQPKEAKFTLPAGSHTVYHPSDDGLDLRLKSAIKPRDTMFR